MTSVRRICGPLGILALFLLVQPVAAAAVPAAGIAAEALAVTYRPHHRQKQWGYHNYHDRVPRHPHAYRADDYRARYYPYFGLHHGYRYHSRPYFRTPLYYHFHF